MTEPNLITDKHIEDEMERRIMLRRIFRLTQVAQADVDEAQARLNDAAAKSHRINSTLARFMENNDMFSRPIAISPYVLDGSAAIHILTLDPRDGLIVQEARSS